MKSDDDIRALLERLQTGALAPAGGLVSSVGDMVRLASALLGLQQTWRPASGSGAAKQCGGFRAPRQF